MDQKINQKIAERLEYFNRKQEEEEERKNKINDDELEEIPIFES